MFHRVFQIQLEEYVSKTLPLELEVPRFALLLASWSSSRPLLFALAFLCFSAWDRFHFTALQRRSKPSHHVTCSTGQLDKHFADEFHGADHSRVNLAFRRDVLRVRIPVA